MTRRVIWSAMAGLVAASLAVLNPVGQAAAPSDRMLAHDVYFTLKDDSPQAKEKLIATCKKYLSDYPGIVSLAVGPVAEELSREVNDGDFDVALHIVFKDTAAHDQYQKSERHLKLIAEFRNSLKKVRVFDSYVEAVAHASSEGTQGAQSRVPGAEACKTLSIQPIGQVQQKDGRNLIVLDKKFQEGLLGLDQWSHVQVIWWFDKNDTPQKRSILQVHPRGDKNNPLTGVFACRAPFRPNLIALSLCKIVSVKDNVVEIEQIDAFEGTPVLDLKPYAPGQDSASNVKVPKWAGPK